MPALNSQKNRYASDEEHACITQQLHSNTDTIDCAWRNMHEQGGHKLMLKSPSDTEYIHGYSYTHNETYIPTHTHSHTHTHTLIHTHTHSPSLTHTLSLSHSHTISLSLSLSLPLPLHCSSSTPWTTNSSPHIAAMCRLHKRPPANPNHSPIPHVHQTM